MQTSQTITVSLVVKGATRQQVKNEITRRLNAWFAEDYSECIPGEGYPEGSLLFWNFKASD